MKTIQVCANQGSDPLQRGDNHKNVKMGWGHLEIILSRTSGPILTRFITNHHREKGIQICSNKGPGPFQRGDNHKNVKMGWVRLKIFFSRTTGPILTRLITIHPWENGFKFIQMKGEALLQEEIIAKE
jgi:hypothetical protein